MMSDLPALEIARVGKEPDAASLQNAQGSDMR